MDAVIVDTAGRLQIDEAMMGELAEVKAAVKPTDTLLVVDAMTGQEAATLVKAFNDAASITGVGRARYPLVCCARACGWVASGRRLQC